MTMRDLVIAGGTLVLGDRLVHGDLDIRGGRIAAIRPEGQAGALPPHVRRIDASGQYVLPGMIDLHSDAIEREIEPRPNAPFPLAMSVFELEKRLAACGITRMYHSVSLADGIGVRDDKRVVEIIRAIRENVRARSMIRHCVHLRYEVTNAAGAATVRELLAGGDIDLLSFMDHTPGQGQFTDNDGYHRYVMKTHGLNLEQAQQSVELLRRNRESVDWQMLRQLADEAGRLGVALASHDDDGESKVELMRGLGASISEFPVRLEAARYAAARGMHVCVGSPNVVRGGSHSSNMRAMDAIAARSADILCSDYVPSSLLPAVFAAAQEGVPLPEAVRMATLNPARAVGIDGEFGSLEPGKTADVLCVQMTAGYPIVRATIVQGEPVYQSGYHYELEEETAAEAVGHAHS